MSLCSIIVLTFNAVEYTRLCLRSILKYTILPYELIMIDNGSTDDTLGYLHNLKSSQKIPFPKDSHSRSYDTSRKQSDYFASGPQFKQPQRITVVRNQQNLGYAKGSNQGASLARGDSLLFLNNDTIVAKNWLTNLLDCLNSTPVVAAVNPCSNFNPYAQITLPGEKLPQIESFANRYNHKNPSKWKENDTASGFCLLVKRKAFDQVGGFDEQFLIGCYEDTDLTLRLHQAGYKIMIAWDTFVYHFGNQTFAANGLNLSHYMTVNALKYFAKHPNLKKK